MSSTPSRRRSRHRIALFVVLVLLALGLDAWAGFNFTVAVGCIGFFVVQFLAMTVGLVLGIVGLVTWIASRLHSRTAFLMVAGALALGLTALLLSEGFAGIGLVCFD